jgi:hypothetical protein
MEGGFVNQVFYLPQGMFVCVPAILYITPDTADITTAKADEPGGFSLVEAFPLERIKGLHDGQGLFCPGKGGGVWYIRFHFFR